MTEQDVNVVRGLYTFLRAEKKDRGVMLEKGSCTWVNVSHLGT